MEIVKYFIEEKGADPNFSSKNGVNAMMFAAQEGHLEVVKYFIEKHNIDIST